MPLVLAIEPDPRQATTLERMVKEHVRTELVVVDSRVAALAVIAHRVPDLILVSAFLGPRDEDELTRRLKSLDHAAHLQTLTIPLLAGEEPDEAPRSAILGAFRRKRRVSRIAGCDPAVFAAEIQTYLQRAAELREDEQREIARLHAATAEQPVEGPRTTAAEEHCTSGDFVRPDRPDEAADLDIRSILLPDFAAPTIEEAPEPEPETTGQIDHFAAADRPVDSIDEVFTAAAAGEAISRDFAADNVEHRAPLVADHPWEERSDAPLELDIRSILLPDFAAPAIEEPAEPELEATGQIDHFAAPDSIRSVAEVVTAAPAGEAISRDVATDNAGHLAALVADRFSEERSASAPDLDIRSILLPDFAAPVIEEPAEPEPEAAGQIGHFAAADARVSGIEEVVTAAPAGKAIAVDAATDNAGRLAEHLAPPVPDRFSEERSASAPDLDIRSILLPDFAAPAIEEPAEPKPEAAEQIDQSTLQVGISTRSFRPSGREAAEAVSAVEPPVMPDVGPAAAEVAASPVLLLPESSAVDARALPAALAEGAARPASVLARALDPVVSFITSLPARTLAVKLKRQQPPLLPANSVVARPSALATVPRVSSVTVLPDPALVVETAETPFAAVQHFDQGTVWANDTLEEQKPEPIAELPSQDARGDTATIEAALLDQMPAAAAVATGDEQEPLAPALLASSAQPLPCEPRVASLPSESRAESLPSELGFGFGRVLPAGSHAIEAAPEPTRQVESGSVTPASAETPAVERSREPVPSPDPAELLRSESIAESLPSEVEFDFRPMLAAESLSNPAEAASHATASGAPDPAEAQSHAIEAAPDTITQSESGSNAPASAETRVSPPTVELPRELVTPPEPALWDRLFRALQDRLGPRPSERATPAPELLVEALEENLAAAAATQDPAQRGSGDRKPGSGEEWVDLTPMLPRVETPPVVERAQAPVKSIAAKASPPTKSNGNGHRPPVPPTVSTKAVKPATRKKRRAPESAISRLAPLAVWARAEQAEAAAKEDAMTADAPIHSPAVVAALRLPEDVAGVRYGSGCRIRRVRVAPRKKEPAKDRRVVILSRKALRELS